jgi:PAS domain-containing protein
MLKNGKILKSFETQRLCKNGEILDVWMTVTSLKIENGKPLEIATTERDISEIRQLLKNPDVT